MSRRAAVLVAGLLVPAAASAQAAHRLTPQARPAVFAATRADTTARPGLTPLRVAKWTTLALATAAGVYGFVENGRADNLYGELERMCEEQRTECRLRTADGAYANEVFETQFQSVRRHDRRAHAALVAGQVGVAASVVLFLLDLGNVRPPDDIPWVPTELYLEPRPDEIRLGFRLYPGGVR